MKKKLTPVDPQHAHNIPQGSYVVRKTKHVTLFERDPATWWDPNDIRNWMGKGVTRHEVLGGSHVNITSEPKELKAGFITERFYACETPSGNGFIFYNDCVALVQ